MPEPFALTDATIVTGERDGTVVAGQSVVVDSAGRIEWVGAASEAVVPTGYRTIDVTGRFVLPGLINAHAHLFSNGKPIPAFLLKESAQGIVSAVGHSPIGRWLWRRRTKANAITQLHTGVTTIRSVGDVAYEVVRVAGEIAAGEYLGPRILPSGPLLAITGGHGAPQIALTGDAVADHRRNARVNLDHGVKAIKVCATGGVTDAKEIGHAGHPEMTEEEMTAVCEEAHRAGISVAAHAQSREGIVAALRAGVDTIEHGADMTTEIVDLFHDNPRSLTGSSSLIPTLQACLPLVKLDRSVTGIDDVVRANAESIFDRMLQGIHDAVENDIRIGMGTDSALTYVTHYNTWRELDLLVRYGGLSPAYALSAATSTNATILRLEDVTGSVEPGKSADLVVVDANPLDGFRTLAEPSTVIVRGAIIDHPAVTRYADLDAQLDTF